MPLYIFFPSGNFRPVFPGSLAGGWRAGGVGEKGRGAAAAKDPVAVRQALSGKPPPPEPSLARRPSPAASLELEPGGPHALLTGGAALASSQGKQPSSLPGGCRAGLGGREVPAQHPASLWPPLPSSGLVEGVRLRSKPPTDQGELWQSLWVWYGWDLPWVLHLGLPFAVKGERDCDSYLPMWLMQ